MKSFLFYAVIAFATIATNNLQAQNSDFASKLKPEYKLNLSPQNDNLTEGIIKKSSAEIKQELKHLNGQQEKIEMEIARMDAEAISKDDNSYIKLQFALKSVKGQIAEREKYLQHYQDNK